MKKQNFPPPCSKPNKNLFNLLISFFTLIITFNLPAQCPLVSSFAIDIVPRTSGQAQNNFACTPLACDELGFDVILRRTSTENLAFEYTYFDLQGKINVNGLESYVDVAKSKACSPAIWDASELGIESNGTITIHSGEPFIDDNTNTPKSIALDHEGKALLFSVVIHASPGTQVTWQNPLPNIGTSPYLVSFVKNQLSIPVCSGTLPVTYGGALTLPQPSACAAVTYNFAGFPPIGAGGNPGTPVSIPIRLSGLPNGTLLEDVEGLVQVRTQNYMDFGDIESELLPNCSNSYLTLGCGIKKPRDYTVNGVHYRDIYFSGKDIVFNSSSNLLLVYLLGPLNRSVEDLATIEVKYIRVKTAGSCCGISAASSSAVTYHFNGKTTCNDFNLAVEELPLTDEDCLVRYKINFSWDSPVASLNIEELKFDLTVLSTLPFNSFTDNTLCPGNSCLSWTDLGNDAYNISCTLSNVTLQQTGTHSFIIVFGGLQGCVKGYAFTKSTIKILGANDQCVPELQPAYTLGDYSRCLARLGGRLFMKMSEAAYDCDNYYVTAKAVQGAPKSCTFTTIVKGDPNVYSFCACGDQFPYTISCSKESNSNPLTGVTTLDLALMSKHILGIEPFNDNYKLAAADANCNGAVSTIDVVELRKLILGINEYLPLDVPSYKIMTGQPTGGSYDEPIDNPNCQPSAKKTVAGPLALNHFYIVKTGDVSWNGNAQGACSGFKGADDRIASDFPLQLEQQNVVQGQRIEIPIGAATTIDLSAIQFELQFDPRYLRLVNIQAGVLPGVNTENLGAVNLSEGLLRFLWYPENGIPANLKRNDVLFYLVFEALATVEETGLWLNKTPGIQAVCYDSAYKGYQIIEKFGAIASGELSVRISPNPFKEAPTVTLHASESEDIAVSVFDALGRLQGMLKITVDSGQQTLDLPKEWFGTPGIYWIDLRSPFTTQTTKAVKQ